LAIGSLICP